MAEAASALGGRLNNARKRALRLCTYATGELGGEGVTYPGHRRGINGTTTHRDRETTCT